MPKLSWISDSDLQAAITELTTAGQDALTQASDDQSKNKKDPFGALLIASTFQIDSSRRLEQLQQAEAALRGMSSALGYFHQHVLGAVDGWQDHDAGYDLESVSNNAVAEVKNKYNTMNSSNRQQVLSDLDTAVRQKGSGWTGYLVIIVPRGRSRYERRLKTTRPVFEIDGASFYHKVTGDPNAIHDLFDVVCDQLAETDEIAEYCKQILQESIPPRSG